MGGGMTIGKTVIPGAQTQAAAPVAVIGALPDAPLAMPKQRLDGADPLGRAVWAALIRPLLVRTGRSEG
jgi:hypothetical protein